MQSSSSSMVKAVRGGSPFRELEGKGGNARLVFLCIAMLFSTAVNAQETLTPEQAVEIALKNNYDILIARNEADVAAKYNTPGFAGMLPTISANVADNFSYNNLNQKFSNGQEINRNNVSGNAFNASVNLNWTLFDGLRMFATKGRLNAEAQIGELNYKDQVQNTVAQVLTAYYNVVSATQQLRAIDTAISIAEERAKLADVKFQVGSSSKVDLLQAKVDANEQRSNALNQRRVIQQRKAELNALLVQPAETEFVVIDTIQIAYEPNAAPELDSKNFQLMAALRNIDVAKFAKREAFSAFLPWLDGSVGYGYTRSQSTAGFSLYNQTYGLTAGFALRIPLFNGLNTINQNQIAKINISSSQYNLERLRIQTKVVYYQALREFQNAKDVLTIEEENITLADENRKIALERFRLAQSTSIELREAQLSYVNAQLRLVNARLAAKAAEIELKRIQGELVK